MRLPVSVKRGVAYLDETEGPDWRDEINVDELEMASSCRCVIGQLDGDFEKGLASRGLTYEDAERLGFYASGRLTFNTLTDAWTKVLAR